MNWGTLILGIVIGAVVVGVVWFASNPGATEGQQTGNDPVQNCFEQYGPPGVTFNPQLCVIGDDGETITCHPEGPDPIYTIQSKAVAVCIFQAMRNRL